MHKPPGYILIFLVVVFCSCSFDTGKKVSASIEEQRIDFNYKAFGHSKFNLFVYKVKQTDNNSRFIRQDTLGLFCTNLPTQWDSLMTQTQWQFMTTDSSDNFTLDRNRYTSHYEGTDSYGDELFLHPARSCFKILQLCPYPYFLNKKTWDWDFEVGALWGVDTLYPINKTEVFHITYTWEKQDELLNCFLGTLECRKLNAVSKSTFGTSYAAYYMNEEHGLVYFTVTAINNQVYEFSLLKKIEGRNAMSKVAPYFVTDHNVGLDVRPLLGIPLR